MKAKKQPLFLKNKPVKINNIWEVRLSQDVWNDIQFIANYKNTTYSWVVRACVFRLVRRKTLRMRPAMEKHIKRIKEAQPPSGECHRHMLCLYGEDEKMLRLAAMQLEITISMLIRLALTWFLKKFKAQFVWSNWLIHNIKLKYRIFNKERSFEASIHVLRRLRRKISGFSRKYLMKREEFYWYGIKITSQLQLDVLNNYGLPTFRRFYFQKFQRDDWFDMIDSECITIPCTL